MTEDLLLEDFLPTYDHATCISRMFRAPPEEVSEAVTNLDLFQLPLARVLLEARALTCVLTRNRGSPSPTRTADAASAATGSRRGRSSD